MDLHTPICDLLCCEQPIILAGMGGVARAELVAAVTEAGGFGFLGMVRESPELIRAQIAEVRARTTRPFGVNLVPAATKAPLLAAEVAACIEARPHAVALFWDVSPPTIEALRGAGILVACQVGSASEAQEAVAAGADVVIAQGWEAGGHVRGRTGLSALLADVVAAVTVPVLAAGGIVDGRGLALVLKAGAQGAVIGTAFLATHESNAHDYHKQRIVEAGPDETLDTQIFHINWPLGATVRVLPNSTARGERGEPFTEKRRPIGVDGTRPIYLFSTDSPLSTMTGDLEAMALYAGQGAGRVSALTSAGDRLRAIASEARKLLARPPGAPARLAESVETSSPACRAAEAEDGYMGFLTREELVSELNTLLEAERAGARVGARLAIDCQSPALKALSKIIHADEVRWCKALYGALVDLKASPSTAVGDFFEKASAIEDVKARLAFVNRGQGWVVRKLREMLPRIREDALHGVLSEMLVAHEVNIASANLELERAP